MMTSLLLWIFGAFMVPTRGAPDNQGTKFVVGFMENYQQNVDIDLFVTTSMATSVAVTVTSPKYTSPSISESFSIVRGQVQKVVINKVFKNMGSGKTTKGILVSANNEVIVYGMNKESSSTDSFLGLPTDVLGTTYYLTVYFPTLTFTELLVVGVTDSTSVTIRFGPNTGLNVTYNNANYYKNDQLTLTLHSYECVQIQTKGDLTGTKVTSTKAIAAFSGNVLVRIPENSGGTRNHLVEQHVPTDKWGKKFIVIPTPTRTKDDTFRFIASEFSTTISVTATNNGSPYSDSFTITSAGQWVEKQYSHRFYGYITSNKPIYVVQFVHSQTSGTEPADPAMIIIPPVEQYAADYSFTTPTRSSGSYLHFFNFICKAADKSGLRLNGNAFPSNTVYTAIPGTAYVGGYLSLTDGTYVVRHTSTTSVFAGYLIGLGSPESYGFPTGMRIAPINTPCTQTTQTTGDGLDNDCDGLIDEEACDLANNYADDDGDGQSEEDCATPYPVHGGWEPWETWSPCACISGVYSNGGTRTRKRSCTNPAPMYNGDQCSGNAVETDTTCSPSSNCRVNGNWNLWTSWTTCPVTCGTGTQERTRTCTNPVPANGGSACAGNSSQTQNCNTNNCPVDGAWTTWSAFTSCDYICGAGTSNRSRSCTNPTPAYGGKVCLGDDSETQACTGTCMVDGKWNSWLSWGTCTKTCGTGMRYRSRKCTNPSPSNGGKACTGDPSMSESCNTSPCPSVAAGTYVQLCPLGWFTCQTGGISCIEESLKCDCGPDCDDASDESSTYGNCTTVCNSVGRLHREGISMAVTLVLILSACVL